jgi:hypothetical protein
VVTGRSASVGQIASAPVQRSTQVARARRHTTHGRARSEPIGGARRARAAARLGDVAAAGRRHAAHRARGREDVRRTRRARAAARLGRIRREPLA